MKQIFKTETEKKSKKWAQIWFGHNVCPKKERLVHKAEREQVKQSEWSKISHHAVQDGAPVQTANFYNNTC